MEEQKQLFGHQAGFNLSNQRYQDDEKKKRKKSGSIL